MTSPDGHHDAALDSLRVTLRAAGYTQEALDRSLSASRVLSSPYLARVVAYLQADGDGLLPLLVRLFSVGATEPRERVARTAPDLDIDGLADAGVLRTDGESVRAVLRIGVVDGVLAAWDMEAGRDDAVVGVSASTTLAAAHTPRTGARNGLDVGTGQGLQALLAAGHCDRVVATDFNPRALWMTRLNARLNQIENIETREGSFFEPVEGESFDLIVANPPYVVTPKARYLYRDASFQGDGLCRRMLTELPRFLDDGGFATLECNWIHRADERWFAPIQRGLVGSGCDAVMVRTSTSEPLEYAAGWNEPHYRGDTDGFERVIREWVDHFDAQGIERISGAMVVLRRRPDGRNWRRAVSQPPGAERRGGAALAALFAAQDRLDQLDDERLLDVPLRVPEQLRVERYERPGAAQSCVLDLDEAIGVRRPVPRELADLVLRIDGGMPLRGVDGAAGQLDGVRALIKLGFVTFA